MPGRTLPHAELVEARTMVMQRSSGAQPYSFRLTAGERACPGEDQPANAVASAISALATHTVRRARTWSWHPRVCEGRVGASTVLLIPHDADPSGSCRLAASHANNSWMPGPEPWHDGWGGSRPL